MQSLTRLVGRRSFTSSTVASSVWSIFGGLCICIGISAMAAAAASFICPLERWREEEEEE